MVRQSWLCGCLMLCVSVSFGVAAAPKEEPVPWQMEPDPLPWKMDKAPSPEKFIQKPPKGKIFFANSPSPYFAIIWPTGKDQPHNLALYDLRTLEQVGKTVQTTLDPRWIKLSPFGDFAVSYDLSASLPTATVCSLKGEDVKPTIKLWKAKVKIEGVDPTGPGQIMSVKEVTVEGKRKRLWEVWDIKTGKVVTSIHYQLEYGFRWIGWSPGCRYLVMQESHNHGFDLLFWDLKTGKMVGKTQIADGNSKFGTCGSLTFSPDGKEMALLWILNKDGILAKIIRYDMTTGKKIGEQDLRDEAKPSYAGLHLGGLKSMQYLPDGRGWMLSGHQIVERETGKIVWAIDPAPKTFDAVHDRRFVDGYHVTTQTSDWKLKVLELPKRDLDAAFKKSER